MKLLALLLLTATVLFAEDGRFYDVTEIGRVVDADTVDLSLDLGFGIVLEERVRLYGINAWETRGIEKPKGLAAKQFVIDKVAAHDGKVRVWVPKKERGKYGRILVILYLGETNINEILVREGHARYQDY